MLTLEIFVPKRLNDGSEAPPETLAEVCAALCEIGGGVTCSDVSGLWVDPRTGREYRDALTLCQTDAGISEADARAELEALARMVRESLRQESVYIRIRPVAFAGAV